MNLPKTRSLGLVHCHQPTCAKLKWTFRKVTSDKFCIDLNEVLDLSIKLASFKHTMDINLNKIK